MQSMFPSVSYCSTIFRRVFDDTDARRYGAACRTRNANRILGCWRRSSSKCGTPSERSFRGHHDSAYDFGTCFEPIFSSTCPLPKEELDFVVNRLTFAKAAPKCCAIVLLVLIAVGVFTCVVSIMLDFSFQRWHARRWNCSLRCVNFITWLFRSPVCLCGAAERQSVDCNPERAL